MDNSDLSNSSNRMQILEMIEEGRLTADEGLHLLQALHRVDAEPAQTGVKIQQVSINENWDEKTDTLSEQTTEIDQEIPLPGMAYDSANEPLSSEATGSPDGSEPFFTSKPEVLPDQSHWKRWWMIPLWVGVGVTVFGGLFMFLAQRSSGVGLWFVCAAVPFTLGLILVVLAWQNRRSPWLHLRVQQPPGEWPEKIAFSFPLPLRPAAWFFNTFGKHIHGLEGQDMEQILRAVGEKTGPESPISIHVDDPDGGEKVDIYIG